MVSHACAWVLSHVRVYAALSGDEPGIGGVRESPEPGDHTRAVSRDEHRRRGRIAWDVLARSAGLVNMYIYIYIYIYRERYIYIYIYTHIYTCIHMYGYYIYIYVYIDRVCVAPPPAPLSRKCTSLGMGR